MKSFLSRSRMPVLSRRSLVMAAVCLAVVGFCLELTFYWVLGERAGLAAVASPEPTASATSPAEAAPPSPSISPSETAVQTEPTAAPTGIATSTPTPNAEDGRFALLLLGYGGGGHDGAYLTDAMMVVIADTNRKTLAMLSLPRDIWAPLALERSGSIYSKLNTAYAYGQDSQLYPNRAARYTGPNGGGTLARDTVAELLGIPIDYYLAIDFAGFREAVDTIGGVDVTVPTTFAAQYPRNDDPSIDASWMTVYFRTGPEHMTGERALQYTRARLAIDNSSEGSDFARAYRQRLVLEAFKSRLVQPAGLARIPQLLGLATKYIRTDYPLPAATDLAKLAVSLGDLRFYEATLGGNTYLQEATGPEDAYILVPRADGASWTDIRAFARRLYESPEVGQAMAGTTVLVVNCSGQSGLGSLVSDRLEALGYAVGSVTTGEASAETRIVDRTGGKASALIDALTKDLDLPAPTTASEKAGASPQVVVELGRDARDAIPTATPTPDRNAPTSAYGVTRFGQWAPTVYVATPTPTVAASPSVTAPAGTPSSGTPGPATGSATPAASPAAAGSPPPSPAGPTGAPTAPPAAPTAIPTAPADQPTTVPGAPSAVPQPAATASPSTPTSW